MVPQWLHIAAIVSLAIAFASSLLIVLDETRQPQNMWIMNVVWPVTALFASVIGLWMYFSYGRLASHNGHKRAADRGSKPPAKQRTPFPIMVAKGTSHCGSGCCVGDIIAEWLAFLVPTVAIWFGWQTLFSEKMIAVWVLDFVFAFLLGIVFQYFTIKPMRNVSAAEGLRLAVKADAASLTAWQIGMYGFMAFAQFYLFRTVLRARLEVDTFEFWFMMQIAMLAGFATSYPVNWWLIKTKIKEAM